MNDAMRRAVADAFAAVGLDNAGSIVRLAAASRSAATRTANLARSRRPCVVPTRPATFHQQPGARDTRTGKNEHRDESDAGKALHGPHRVAIRGRCPLAGAIEKERERQQAAHPDARAEQVHHVDGLQPWAFGGCGQVAGTPEKNQSERGQQKCFAPGSDPVLSGGNVAAQEQKGRQHDQQTVTHHP